MGLRPEVLECVVISADALTVFRRTNTLQYSGGVSKVDTATPMPLIYNMFFPSISTFETPPLGDTHGQKTARMEGLPSCDIVEPQVTRYRVYLRLGPYADVRDSPVDFVQQGQHLTRSTRIPWGHECGEDKTGRGFRGDAGLSAKLCRAIPLALDNRGNGEIVGLDQLTVAELLAVGKPCRLLPEVVMVAHRRGERQRETLTLRLAQADRVFEAFLGLEA